jgi:hypothetical protein
VLVLSNIKSWDENTLWKYSVLPVLSSCSHHPYASVLIIVRKALIVCGLWLIVNGVVVAVARVPW